MAYALIAGLPPVYGLYAALVPQLVYAILGTSRHLAVGPVAMDSLIVAAGLGALSLAGPKEYIAMAVLLALMVGLIQLILGLLRMGFLVNFLSRPVISGFTSAAALIIGIGQLKNFLGLEMPETHKLHELLLQAIFQMRGIHLPSLGIGLSALLLILGLRRLHKAIPAAVVVVILGIFFAFVFRLDLAGVQVVGHVPAGLPDFHIPGIKWERLPALFPLALTLALIAFMEAASVAKALEQRHTEYAVNPSQELIALGTSNIVGSFFQAYPSTGGFSRTAVNEQAGAHTGVASWISAAVVGLTLLFLTPLFYYLPKAVLAAIIMVAVFGLIDYRYPVKLFKYRKDEFVLLLITFLVTVEIGIKEGIILGVLLSLLLLVYRTSRPHIAVLGRIRGTQYFRNVNRFPAEVEVFGDVLVIRFDGQLYFGNMDYFKQETARIMREKPPGLKYLVLNAEAIHYVDSSAAEMLIRWIRDLKSQGITLLLAGVIGPVRDILYNSGILEEMGKELFFMDTSEAFAFSRGRQDRSDRNARMAWQTKNTLM